MAKNEPSPHFVADQAMAGSSGDLRLISTSQARTMLIALLHRRGIERRKMKCSATNQYFTADAAPFSIKLSSDGVLFRL